MPRILLLTDAYLPELGSSTYLMHGLASWLKNKGSAVWVMTCKPRYNLAAGEAAVPESPSSSDSGIEVVRVSAPAIHKVHPVLRGLGEVSLIFLFVVKALRLNLKADAVIAYSPPLTIGVAACLLGMLKKTPVIVNVQDIFPKNAVDLGILQNRWLIKFFESLEHFVYRRASFITVHSESNRQLVIARGAAEDKVSVVPNWVDFSAIQEGTPGALERFGLEGRFVLSYGGVMGYSQDLDVILESAYLVRDKEEIAFLLLGDGTQRPRLETKARSLGLRNVVFHDLIPREDYWSVLRAVEVALVTLRAEVRTPAVPFKIMGYMASGKPVLSAFHADSDAADLIRRSRCGMVCRPGDAQAMASAVLKLYSDSELRRQYGRQGLEYARKYLSKDYVLGRYDDLLEQLISKRSGTRRAPRFSAA